MDMVTFSLGLLAGMIIATALFGAGVFVIIKSNKPIGKTIKRMGQITGAFAFTALVAVLMMAGRASIAFAQDDTPVPLVIPVNTIFTQTNNWLATFAPIAAIGIGITLALAVLTYLGKMIKSAFV